MDFSAAAVERTQTRKTEAAAAGLTARVEEPQPETRGLMKGKGNTGTKVRVRPCDCPQQSLNWHAVVPNAANAGRTPPALSLIPNAVE